MDSKQLKKVFSELNTWKRGGERAPHKPLLLLYYFGRISRGEPRMAHYQEIKDKLRYLLYEFGPPRLIRTNYPFVRMQNDGIWEISGKTVLDTRKDWSNKTLIENETLGGFTEEVYSILLKNKKLIEELSSILLELNFPESMHEDILDAVGLSKKITNVQRDAQFRECVLRAYEYKCAVCGFNVRLRHTLVAVEAAHIKWRQAGGPDTENNGIALCSMHHKLFDRGVFTLSLSGELRVSEMAHGENGFEEWLLRYHGKTIRYPINPTYQPLHKYISWHSREVFKWPERY